MSVWNARLRAEEILEIIDAVLDGRYAPYEQDSPDIKCFAVSVRKDGLEMCNDLKEAIAQVYGQGEER